MTSRSRGVRRAIRSAAVLRQVESFSESWARSNARRDGSPKAVRANRFLEVGGAGFHRRIAIVTSPWPVIMIAGRWWFSTLSRSKSAIPPMPASRIDHEATPLGFVPVGREERLAAG